MKWKVSENILEQIKDRYPMLRFKETQFLYVAEEFLSTQKDLIPFQQKETIHRVLAQWIPNSIKFESEKKNFLETCKLFFNLQNITLENKTHELLTGELESLEIANVDNWKVIKTLLDEFKLQPYISSTRKIVSIPFGSTNLNVVKVKENFYLEVVNYGDVDSVSVIQKDLQGLEESTKPWILL